MSCGCKSRIKEGLIPTVIGTLVTVGAAASRYQDVRRHGIMKRDRIPMLATAILGFGLAHIVLGAIDLVQE